MPTKAELLKRQPLTAGELLVILQRVKPDARVYIGKCDVCTAEILSFKGPEIECPGCEAPLEIRPLMFRRERKSAEGT